MQAGDTIDFVTDCLSNETSDSFHWRVELTLKTSDGSLEKFDSAAQFQGPLPDIRQLPAHIQHAWRLAFCRDPSPEELRLTVDFAADQLQTLYQNKTAVSEGSSTGRQVLVNLCQMLFNSNEFLYVD